MKRLLLTSCFGWMLLLLAMGSAYAQQASARLECCADEPICAGETASLWVALEGTAPYSFRYTDGTDTYTVSTSQALYELKVRPSSTKSYRLLSMQDVGGAGQTCGTATVAVNQCQPPTGGKDCSDNCFSSEVIDTSTSGSCTTYTVKVNNDGSCSSALSHFSLSIPCGTVTQASNSRGWAMEVGTTDPTTGLTGIKIDNIKGFGENGKAGSFTVTYTVCASSCGGSDPYCGFLVAFKAGQCVNYGTATPPYQPMSGSLQPSPVRCYGESNGQVALTLSGGSAPYTYRWNTGATTANLQHVAANTYTLTITDAANKQLVLKATVGQPQPLSLQASTSATSCGSNNGALDLLVAGGTTPYTYQWSNGSTHQDLSSLAAGTYTVTVTDAKGCTATGNYSIQSSGGFQLSLNGGSANCGTATALTASISGGSEPYTYSWNTGATTPSITPTAAGTYTLTVTDASGCTVTASKTIAGGSPPPVVTYEYSSPSCYGSTDGWIDVNVSGGSGSYTYSWSNGATAQDLEGISAGTYTLIVTDASGCKTITSITLPQTRPITISATEITQPDCLGNLGSLTVTATNGTAPYTYSWTHGPSGQSLEDLEPGYYTVVVKDALGCQSNSSFQIKEPSTPNVQLSGGACGNSSLTAIVTGGTAPYTYSWSNGSTTESISVEEGATYKVVITDDLGCTAEQEVTIGEIGSAIAISATTTAPSCYGSTDGSIDLNISGGSGYYTVRWPNGITSEDLSNVGAGTYTVVVTDGNTNCSKTATFTITNPAPITLQATEVVSATCNSLGSIMVAAQGGTAPYTYQWEHGPTGNSLSQLQAGSYTVTVTDSKGCNTKKSFTIQQDAAPTVRIATTPHCSSYELSAQVSGGSGSYTYTWSNGSTDAKITTSISGVYTVTVTDGSGCPAVAEAEVSVKPSELVLHAQVQDISCGGMADGAATITVTSGGVAPYTYDWTNGLKTAAGANLAAGAYSVKVTDAKGCSQIVAFEIKQSSAMALSLASGTPSSCGQSNGSLSVAVVGGIAPYTYKWKAEEGTAPLTVATSNASLQQVAPGTYTVAVIDAIGCSAEASFTVEASAAGSTVSAWMDNCSDMFIEAGSTAQLQVNFQGEGPYTFTYTDGKQVYTATASASPYSLQVQPYTNTTYTLLSVANGCGEGSAQGMVTVAVVAPKTAVCTDGCFSTVLTNTTNRGNCNTYTLEVSADGSCSYELSHFNIALSCGQVSNMSNSKGWPMSINQDPTTGLYSIKVDNIQGMGKSGSFTVTYTLCNTEACIDAENYCGPLVAYKAGQCVYYGQATPGSPVSETPDDDDFLGPDMVMSLYPNPAQYGSGFTVQVENLFISTPVQITILSLTGQKMWEQSIPMTPDKNWAYIQPALQPGSYIVFTTITGTRYSQQLLVN